MTTPNVVATHEETPKEDMFGHSLVLSNGDDGNILVEDAHDETVHVPDWDPFGGVVAHNGYTFTGKIAFIIFGPTSLYFDPILQMGGGSLSGSASDLSVAGKKKEQKENSCMAMRERKAEQAANECS